MKNSIAITGAGSGVGEGLAYALKDEDVSLRLIGGRRAEQLRESGIRASASEVIPGDLLDSKSTARHALMTSRDPVIAHMAAINLDTHPVEEERVSLGQAQTDLLETLIEVLKKNSPDDKRLFVDMNSVVSFFAAENARVAALPYAQMKLQQAKILTQARADLQKAGVELLVVYPGAIRTDMLKHLEDERAVRMANLLGKKLKKVPDHPNGLEQDRMFEPAEVGAAVAQAINYFLVNGEIPAKKREWIMSNSAELYFQ